MAKHYLVVVVLVTQSCPTLCNLVDYSPPGSSVHGILQARILEWVAVPFSLVSPHTCQHFILFVLLTLAILGLPRLSDKESACQCKRRGFDLWIRKIPCRRAWQPTLVFLPGKSHRQRSLASYSSWDCQRHGHDLVTKTTEQKRGYIKVFHCGLKFS